MANPYIIKCLLIHPKCQKKMEVTGLNKKKSKQILRTVLLKFFCEWWNWVVECHLWYSFVVHLWWLNPGFQYDKTEIHLVNL